MNYNKDFLRTIRPEFKGKEAYKHVQGLVDSVVHTLLTPQPLVLHEMNSEPQLLSSRWEESYDVKEKTLKFCLTLPTEYNGIVANIGVGILYDQMLRRHNKKVIFERAYYQEKRMIKVLLKEGCPLFSKETYHPLNQFEVLGFSAYFPPHYLNFVTMLEYSGIPCTTEERFKGERNQFQEPYPLVIAGGIQLFNPECVYKIVDAVVLGEADTIIHDICNIIDTSRTKTGEIDKEKVLWRFAKETEYIYVPSFYEVTYHKGFGVKEFRVKDEYKEVAKSTIHRHIEDISNIEPNTNTISPVIETADMSVSAVELTRGCYAQCRFCVSWDTLVPTTLGVKKIKDIVSGDFVLSYNKETGTVEPKRVLNVFNQGVRQTDLYKQGNRELRMTPDHKVLTKGGVFEEAAACLSYRKELMRPKFISPTVEDFCFEAFMVAVICADFYLGCKHADRVSISQLNDRNLLKFLDSVAPPTYAASSKGGRATENYYNYKHLFCKIARQYVGHSLSQEKDPKYPIDSYEKAVSIVFGFMCTDMSHRYAKRGGTIYFSSVSEKLCAWISSALWYLGISHIYYKQHDRYACSVSAKGDVAKLYKIQDVFDCFVHNDFQRLDTITVSIKKPYAFGGQSEIDGKMEEVYDIEVEDTHCFLANGFIVHNCEGSARTLPARERSKEAVLKAFNDLKWNSGHRTFGLYGFNLTDHSCVEGIILELINDPTAQLQYSTTRMDLFSRDFARVAALLGERNVTMAIEGPSQRLRDSMNKNLTEEKIMEAIQACFESGLHKLKVYMIANLPWETQDDMDDPEWGMHSLLHKIYDIKVKYEAMYRKMITVKFSFTAFTAKSHCVWQWAPCDGVAVRNVSYEHIIKEANKVGMGFRLSASSDNSYFCQICTLSDRRFCDVIIDLVTNNKVDYYGGMALGKEVRPELDELLKEIGHDFRTYMDEKPIGTYFPWAHLDSGSNYAFQLSEYKLSKEFVQSNFGCAQRCVSCGACDKVKDILPKMKNGSFYKPTIMRKENYDGKKLSDVIDKVTVTRAGEVGWALMKFKVEGNMRFLPNKKIKQAFIRSMYRAGVIASNHQFFFSDKHRVFDYSQGIDYMSTGILKHAKDQKAARAVITEELKALGIELVNVYQFRSKMTLDNLTDTQFVQVYLDRTFRELETRLEEYNAVKEVIVKVKVPGMMQGSIETEEVDLKQTFKSLWVEPVEDNRSVCVLRALTKLANPSLYDLIPWLLGTSKNRAYAYQVQRIEYFAKGLNQRTINDRFDMNKRKIEFNIFGALFNKEYAAKSMPSIIPESLGLGKFEPLFPVTSDVVMDLTDFSFEEEKEKFSQRNAGFSGDLVSENYTFDDDEDFGLAVD